MFDKKRNSGRSRGIWFAAFLLSLMMFTGTASKTVLAAENEMPQLWFEIRAAGADRADNYGNRITVTVHYSDSEGNPISGGKIYIKYNNFSRNVTTDESGSAEYTITGINDDNLTLYAANASSQTAKPSPAIYPYVKTEVQTIRIVKQEKPAVQSEPASAADNDGKLVMDESGAYGFEYTIQNPTQYPNAALSEVDGNTIEELAAGTYYVRKKSYYSDGTLYLSSDYTNAEIKKDQTIVYHQITLEKQENVFWSLAGDGTFSLKEGSGSKSVYLTPKEGYYVKNVVAEPSDGAEIQWNSQTGEVLIQNVTNDIRVFAETAAQKTPAQIEVGYQFAEDTLDVEEIPSAKVQYTIHVYDDEKNPCPNADVYVKLNKSEVSYTYKGTTDNEGVITWNPTYFAEVGDYITQFSFTGSFEQAVEQEIHIVAQDKKNLVLYEDQIHHSRPDSADGEVINLNDAWYEYYTYPLKQGAIISGAGSWKSPVDGKITGLAPGQYALRFKEHADYENHTLYLHSGYTYFVIERGQWRVAADAEASEHVSFGLEETYAEPGGTVYFYVTPDEGYVITDYMVSNPNYISEISYDEEEGYLAIEGVTGSISVIVSAKKIVSDSETNVTPEEPTDPGTSVTPEEPTDPGTNVTPEEPTDSGTNGTPEKTENGNVPEKGTEPGKNMGIDKTAGTVAETKTGEKKHEKGAEGESVNPEKHAVKTGDDTFGIGKIVGWMSLLAVGAGYMAKKRKNI